MQTTLLTRSRRRLTFLLLSAALVFVVIEARGHSGGLNREGCHRDHKRGGYHCHSQYRGDSRGSSYSSSVPGPEHWIVKMDEVERLEELSALPECESEPQRFEPPVIHQYGRKFGARITRSDVDIFLGKPEGRSVYLQVTNKSNCKAFALGPESLEVHHRGKFLAPISSEEGQLEPVMLAPGGVFVKHFIFPRRAWGARSLRLNLDGEEISVHFP